MSGTPENKKAAPTVVTSPNRRRGVVRGAVRGLVSASVSLLPFALTGCLLTHTHSVQRTQLAPDVKSATAPELLAILDRQDKALQTMSATVEITATTGGEQKGVEKQYTALTGYIFFRRPADLRMLMLLPLVRSRAIDMVSDGQNFKLLITFPGKKLAITGKDEYTTGGKNGLENIRPYIVRDALLIPPPGPDEYISLTESSRILPPQPGQKVLTEEPQYDVTISRVGSGHFLERVRVIHFGRITLHPSGEDIYHEGRIVTRVVYGRYSRYNELDYPTEIEISRPQDEYKLRIDFTKLTLNGKMADDEFLLKLPEGVPVQKM